MARCAIELNETEAERGRVLGANLVIASDANLDVAMEDEVAISDVLRFDFLIGFKALRCEQSEAIFISQFLCALKPQSRQNKPGLETPLDIRWQIKYHMFWRQKSQFVGIAKDLDSNLCGESSDRAGRFEFRMS
jgi:hypothetical protein